MTNTLYVERGLGKLKVNALRRKKLERQNSWQQAKHANLYSDLVSRVNRGKLV